MEIVTERELENRFGALPWGEPRAVVSGNFATPHRLMDLFDAAVESYRVFMLNAQRPVPTRAGVVPETPFVGPAMRDLPGLDYLPMRLSLVPRLFDVARPPDVVLVHTSAVRAGKVSLGAEVNILPAAIERARARNGLVVAQVNARMPYTFGDGELDLDLIDLAIEVDEDLAAPIRRPVSDETAAIGTGVASLVEDGSTIQVGIGEVPDAVLASLVRFRGIGVWTEAVSDGLLELEHAGALEEDQPIVTTFLFGSPELYAWVDANPRVRVLRTETVNNPSTISSRRLMCSINTALQVDLREQANASFVRGRIYSGFGGQPDFVVGALHSDGGHAVIALPSWHSKSDTSTIVDHLDEPVTSFQHSAVVTEQGRAMIFGRSQRAQARLLIEQAAHPAAREALWESARLAMANEGNSRSAD
ncbi:MAG TPA: acetyl-CoA hydrolase/transferase C-terminal domain-containing protein [Acidimicrobiales bacterium]|nr:acetyl-CoA hydrolase/transferase C-terminal domain-containing protein [Acidimicrobiales bacterium]